MRITTKIKNLNFIVLFLTMITFSTTITANNNLNFKEIASTIMINTLEKESKDSFLSKLYMQLFFIPIWIDEDKLSSLSNELFDTIINDKSLSKSTRLYQSALAIRERINTIYAQNEGIKAKVSMEFKISQLYKGYADYRLYGSINWGAFNARLYNLKAKSINAGWITHPPKYSPISFIENAVISGKLKEKFNKIKPKDYRYVELEKALIRYVDIQKSGRYIHLPLRGNLRVGKSYNVVPLLRDRLALMSDATCNNGSQVYTKCLRNGVKNFQRRNGLIANGVIRKDTIKAFNISLEDKILKIRLNLDRIKWLNERNQQRHIIINIPSFTLYFEDNNELIQKMKVITGKKNHPTPVFSNTVKTIVLNPHWNIPKSIIQKEMIPKLIRNPNAMARRGIEIRRGWGKGAKIVNPRSINWGEYRYSKSVPFHFAQVPGYRNALGKIKFLFPNKFSVYMHDTPNKKLFGRNVRAFSHGCVRLSNPRGLLKTFSTFNSNISFESSKKRLKGSKKAYLSLENQVAVDIVYLTAFIDYSGVLNFRRDIYGYDKMQLLSYRKW